MKPVYVILLLSIGSLFLVIGCNEGPSALKNEPPPLPPAETLEMNFNSWDELKETDSSPKELSNRHVSQAAEMMKNLEIINDLFLEIPLEILTTAQDINPVHTRQNEWLRSYALKTEEGTYLVRLIGSYESNEKNKWRIYITNKNLNIKDQLFISGWSSEDSMHGGWTFYSLKDSDSPPELAKMKWELQQNNRDQQLTITSKSSSKKGDRINYKVNNFVKTVSYYNAEEDITIETQVNKQSNIGYVIADNYFEGKQACWNEHLYDIPCGDL